MRSDWKPWVILIILLALGGCVRVDIGDNLPTVGEQLMDLYDAHASGVINDAEFKKMKARVLRSMQL
jgi:hypothetical protein